MLLFLVSLCWYRYYYVRKQQSGIEEQQATASQVALSSDDVQIESMLATSAEANDNYNDNADSDSDLSRSSEGDHFGDDTVIDVAPSADSVDSQKVKINMPDLSTDSMDNDEGSFRRKVAI